MSAEPDNMGLAGMWTLPGRPSVMIFIRECECQLTEPNIVRKRGARPDSAGMVPVSRGIPVTVALECHRGRLQVRNAAFSGNMLGSPEELC